MSKIVRRHVAVHDPVTREAHWFYPGDKLPEWAEDLVTNPKVFIGESEESQAEKPEEMVVEETKAVNYSGMNISQLDLLLEERGLATSGNKNDKIERLKAHDGALS